MRRLRRLSSMAYRGRRVHNRAVRVSLMRRRVSKFVSSRRGRARGARGGARGGAVDAAAGRCSDLLRGPRVVAGFGPPWLVCLKPCPGGSAFPDL